MSSSFIYLQKDDLSESIMQVLPIQDLAKIIADYAIGRQRLLVSISRTGQLRILGYDWRPVRGRHIVVKHKKGLVSSAASVGRYLLLSNYTSDCFVLKLNPHRLISANNTNLFFNVCDRMSEHSFRHKVETINIRDGAEAGFVAVPGTLGSILAVADQSGIQFFTPNVTKEGKGILKEVCSFYPALYESAKLGLDENLNVIYLFTQPYSAGADNTAIIQIQKFDHKDRQIVQDSTVIICGHRLSYLQYITFIPKWNGFILRGGNVCDAVILFYSLTDGNLLDLTKHMDFIPANQNGIVVTDHHLVVALPEHAKTEMKIRYLDLHLYPRALDFYHSEMVSTDWPLYWVPSKAHLFAYDINVNNVNY